MPDMPSLEIRLLAQQGAVYPVEMTLTETQQVFRGQVAGDIATWSATGDSRVDGQTLFNRLFASADLMRGWGVAHGRAKQLRAQLRIDAVELHALPWELLRDDQDLLAAAADSPFSRYLAVSRAWGQPITERPIRVLAVISNPKDIEEKYGLPPADVEMERQALNLTPGSSPENTHSAAHTRLPPEAGGPPGALRGASRKQFSGEGSDRSPSLETDSALRESPTGRLRTGLGGEMRWTFLSEPVTLDRLEAELRNGYHILHFIGHGAFSTKTQQAALYLQDASGNAQRVIDDDFTGMLNRLASPPHLVVLAACQSAQQSMKAAFSGLGPKLVQIGVPAVIAMQENVTVLTARQFAATFYQRLLAHGMVDLAMNEARGTLITQGRFDAAVPVLFMRLPDGRLWDVAALKKAESRKEDAAMSEDNSKNRSGGVNFGKGNVTVGGDVVGRDKITTTNTGLSGEDVANLFASIYQRIEAKPELRPRDKDDLKADVKDVEAETAKVAQGEKADESFLERRLRSIARMAPDILDVMANTFASPALGAATVIRKVIDRVRQEAV